MSKEEDGCGPAARNIRNKPKKKKKKKKKGSKGPRLLLIYLP
jgi:hypothetical protein